MMTHEDLTGKTWCELTAVRYIRHDFWLWRCSCGKEIEARVSSVKIGKIKSCGHIRAETARKKIVTDNTVEHWDNTTVSKLRAAIASPKTRGIRERHYKDGTPYWQARIMLRGEDVCLGSYSTREAAEKARRQAEQEYYLPIITEYDKQKGK